MKACSKMLRVTNRILACGTEKLVLPFTNREDTGKIRSVEGEERGRERETEM